MTPPHITEFDVMRSYPKTLHAVGNLELLKRPKVSIVGTRKPNQYTQQATFELSSKLSHAGVCIVSGGAMGVDAISHKAAGASNTIAVLPCGIDVKYPAVNAALLSDIQADGLLLSPFDYGFKATKWSFVTRNELVVALGSVLVVMQADLNSGSMRSVAYAQSMGKPVFVLPHRLHESDATNALLAQNQAQAIYDIDAFVKQFAPSQTHTRIEDDFRTFCMSKPTYEEAVKKFGNRIFEAELMGEIEVLNGIIVTVG